MNSPTAVNGMTKCLQISPHGLSWSLEDDELFEVVTHLSAQSSGCCQDTAPRICNQRMYGSEKGPPLDALGAKRYGGLALSGEPYFSSGSRMGVSAKRSPLFESSSLMKPSIPFDTILMRHVAISSPCGGTHSAALWTQTNR